MGRHTDDATNSVYRMVQGAVTDFFRQTVLDFVYGYTGLSGLEKYYDQLDSRDPAEVVRLARVRASAIESCKRDLVPEHEQVVGGWTMCSPCEENQIHSSKLEEKVVLLVRNISPRLASTLRLTDTRAFPDSQSNVRMQLRLWRRDAGALHQGTTGRYHWHQRRSVRSSLSNC